LLFDGAMVGLPLGLTVGLIVVGLFDVRIDGDIDFVGDSEVEGERVVCFRVGTDEGFIVGTLRIITAVGSADG